MKKNTTTRANRPSSSRGVVKHRNMRFYNPHGPGRVGIKRLSYDTHSGTSVTIRSTMLHVGRVPLSSRVGGVLSASSVAQIARREATRATSAMADAKEYLDNSVASHSWSEAAQHGASSLASKGRDVAARTLRRTQRYEDFVYAHLGEVNYYTRHVFDRKSCTTTLDRLTGGDSILGNSLQLFFDTCEDPVAFRRVAWSCLACANIDELEQHLSYLDGNEVSQRSSSRDAMLLNARKQFFDIITDDVTSYVRAYFQR